MLCEEYLYDKNGFPLNVLILVLMEDALRATQALLGWVVPGRLNPCSNGRCSASGSIESDHPYNAVS